MASRTSSTLGWSLILSRRAERERLGRPAAALCIAASGASERGGVQGTEEGTDELASCAACKYGDSSLSIAACSP